MRALIIDDEESICQSLAGVMSDEGWKSVTAHSGMDGIAKFRIATPDLVFLDVWMEGMDGIETLQRLKEFRNDIPVVIMSGHGSIETAVRATKLGAFDYLEKPLSLEKILPILDHAAKIKRSKDTTTDRDEGHYQLIGESAPIVKLRKQIEMVAPRNAWVLLTGENGTGKEVVARNLHLKSSRRDQPFVAINCAAIPEELIESELFGHAKGAFTNAIANKKGKFELADKGTLFLDEIADMSLKTQAKILRILQEQQLEPVGSDESIEVDVRVIAATNKDLESEIAKGNFREDLYYRLNVIPFCMPPLRDRGEDVLLLAEHFLSHNAAELAEKPKTLDENSKRAFMSYPWPGNVRELRNVVERICVMSLSDVVSLSDLPEKILQSAGEEVESSLSPMSAATLKEAKNEFEKGYILEKLQENQWNVSKTAESIGIERSNLHRKLKSFDIDPKELKG